MITVLDKPEMPEPAPVASPPVQQQPEAPAVKPEPKPTEKSE